MKKGTIAVLFTFLGTIIGASISGYMGSGKIKQKTEKVDKFKSYYNMLNQWLYLKQNEKGLDKYFEIYQYQTIAIYGMGEMGNRLYDELTGSNIIVKYAIDKYASETHPKMRVIGMEEEFEKVDAIVVTATFAFEEIQKQLNEKTDIPVISLEDIVYEL